MVFDGYEYCPLTPYANIGVDGKFVGVPSIFYMGKIC